MSTNAYFALQAQRTQAMGVGWIGRSFLIVSLLFATSDGFVEFFIPDPDPQRMVALRLADDFDRLTGGRFTVVVAEGNLTDPVFIDKPDMSVSVGEGVNRVERTGEHKAVDMVLFAILRAQNAIFIGFLDENIKTDQVNHPDFVDLKMVRRIKTYGDKVPTEPAYIQFYSTMGLDGYGVASLRRKSPVDPDMERLYRDFLPAVRIWNKEAEFDPEVTSQLKSEVAWPYETLRFWGVIISGTIGVALTGGKWLWLSVLYGIYFDRSAIGATLRSIKGLDREKFKVVNFWIFRRSENLEDMEKEVISKLRVLKHRQEEEKKLAEFHDAVDRELETFIDKFADPGSKERQLISAALMNHWKLHEKRWLVSSINAKLSKSAAKKSAEEIRKERLQWIELLTKLYHSTVGAQPDPEALDSFLKSENEVDLKNRISLIQEAIRLHKAARVPLDRSQKAELQPVEHNKPAEDISIDLRQRVYERLRVDDLFAAEDLDPEMCKAILVASFAPSQSGRRSGRHHARGTVETGLQKRVETIYPSLVGKPFNRDIFQRSLKWLFGHGVVDTGDREFIGWVSDEAKAVGETAKALVREMQSVSFHLTD